MKRKYDYEDDYSPPALTLAPTPPLQVAPTQLAPAPGRLDLGRGHGDPQDYCYPPQPPTPRSAGYMPFMEIQVSKLQPAVRVRYLYALVLFDINS